MDIQAGPCKIQIKKPSQFKRFREITQHGLEMSPDNNKKKTDGSSCVSASTSHGRAELPGVTMASPDGRLHLVVVQTGG